MQPNRNPEPGGENSHVNRPLEGWQLDAVLRYLADAVVVADQEGKVLYHNPAFERLTGLTGDEIVQRSIQELLPCDYPSLWESLEADQPWRGEVHCVYATGAAFDADVVVTPMRRQGEQARQLICTLRDITHLKDVQRLKARFVAQVSNELRNPITHLKTYLTLLQRGKPEKRDQYLATLSRELAHLETLIEKLFSLSQLDLQEADQLERQKVNLNSLASQMAARFASVAADQRIILGQDLDHHLPLVEANAGLVIQALTNLVDNAITYTPAGGRVTLRTGVMKRDESLYAALIVQDTGQGITPAEQARLFEPFVRGETSRELGVPGTGLGLAIVQQIARLHRGHVEVRSDGVPGKGSTFTLLFPII